MSLENMHVFGRSGVVDIHVAVSLGFNGDEFTGYIAPSFGVPKTIGNGLIFHAKPWGENIVVVKVVLKGEDEPSYYLRTFEGRDPIEMDSLNPEEGKLEYEKFLKNVMQVVNPEFRVTPDELKSRLEELSREQ